MVGQMESNPDEQLYETPRTRRWLWVPLVCLALAALAGWLSLPAYRQWKLKRFQAKAREYLAQTNLQSAWFSAHTAFILNTNNADSLHLLADISGRANSPETVFFRRWIAEREPSAMNALLWAQAALAFEGPPFTETTKALESVPNESRETADYHYLAAGLELKRGNLGKAEEHFVRVLALSPTNTQATINLAVIRLRSPDAGQRAEAEKTLGTLRSSPATRISVLRSLIGYSIDTKQFDKALGYSKELLNESAATFEDKIAHLNLLKQANSAELNPFLETVQRASSKPEQVAPLAGWMGGNGMADAALAWIKTLPGDTQSATPVEMSVADLYAAKKEWRAMEAYLRDQSWGDREFVRDALLAFALRNAGDEETAKGRWNRALRTAEEEPHLLAGLARLAIAWGWNSEAEQVLWRSVEKYPQEKWPWQTLTEAYGRAGSTAGLKRVFAKQLEIDPKDDVARNNLAATDFLLMDDLGQGHRLAKEVYDHDPKNPAFIATYAYSLQLQGKNAEALALFEQLKPEQRIDPSTAVYYGVVLAAKGDRDRAREILQSATRISMLPEERKLAADTLARL
jgi:Flp pilus assembly protein TadD